MPRKFLKRKLKKTKDAKQDRQIRVLSRRIGVPEYKYSGAIQDITQTSNTCIIYGITDGIAQGTDGSTRIGDQISVKRISCKFYGFNNNNAETVSNWVRFVLFWDDVYQGTDPTPGNILQAYVTTDHSLTNLLTDINSDRFKMPFEGTSGKTKAYRIIKDWRMMLPSITTSGSVGLKFIHKVFNYKYGQPVQFSASNQRMGRLTLAVFPGGDQTSGSNPYWGFDISTYYTDD